MGHSHAHLLEVRRADSHRALLGGIRVLGALEGEEVLHVDVGACPEPAAHLHGRSRRRHEQPSLVDPVAHDLENPLASITVLVSLVQERLAGVLGLEGEAEDLRLVRTECARLARMISDLLVVSRIERKRLLAVRAPVAIISLVPRAGWSVSFEAVLLLAPDPTKLP